MAAAERRGPPRRRTALPEKGTVSRGCQPRSAPPVPSAAPRHNPPAVRRHRCPRPHHRRSGAGPGPRRPGQTSPHGRQPMGPRSRAGSPAHAPPTPPRAGVSGGRGAIKGALRGLQPGQQPRHRLAAWGPVGTSCLRVPVSVYGCAAGTVQKSPAGHSSHHIRALNALLFKPKSCKFSFPPETSLRAGARIDGGDALWGPTGSPAGKVDLEGSR